MEEASIAFNMPGEEVSEKKLLKPIETVFDRRRAQTRRKRGRERKRWGRSWQLSRDPRRSPCPMQLHQLLTEQLQEDLLDDSVSTVTTEDGAADSTLLGEGMGVSLDHVTSPIQSCDLLPVNGAESGELLSGSEPAGQSGCGQKEVSDVFSGTAQAYSLVHCLQNSQPPATQLERDNHTHQEVTSSPLIEGCGQLEVLYGARCRQVTELTQQLAQAREEKERQERVLRYEKVSERGRGGVVNPAPRASWRRGCVQSARSWRQKLAVSHSSSARHPLRWKPSGERGRKSVLCSTHQLVMSSSFTE